MSNPKPSSQSLPPAPVDSDRNQLGHDSLDVYDLLPGGTNKAPPTPEESARKRVEHLNFLCRIGKEGWEMETEVHSVGAKIGLLFAKHLEKNPPSFLPDGLKSLSLSAPRGARRVKKEEERRMFFSMQIEMLFNFIYLFGNDRQRSITRYSERRLEQLLIEGSHELGHLQLLKQPLFYAMFEEAFIFLEHIGIPVRAKLRIQQLRKIHKRMLQSDPQQFAMN